MNSIGKSQNEEKYLMFQYSARYYFNRAENLNYLVWITCVVNTIVCNLSLTGLEHVKLPITFALAMLSIYLQFYFKKYIGIASSMRKYVDYHLFEFKNIANYNNYNEDKLIEKAINVINKNQEKARVQFDNAGTGKKRGVKDWYTAINPKDNKCIAVLNCQKQNVRWDRKLTELYIKIIRVLVVTFFAALLIVFSKNNVIDVICFLMSFSALVAKAICEYITICDYKKVSIAVETLLETTPEIISNKYLMEIQSRIDQRRNMPFLAPDLLHKISTKKFHAILSAGSKVK